MSGPAAGLYDPTPAMFYIPQRTTEDNGEPNPDVLRKVCSRYIRYMSRSSREFQVQNQSVSVNILVFRCRRDSITEAFTADMTFKHGSRWYGITAVNPIDYSTDEVEFVAQGVLTPPL